MSNSSTVVTCYYRVPSKHSHDKYDQWITNFLSNIPCNLVIFTSPDLVDYIKNKRITLLEKTIIIPIKFESLPLYNQYKHLWENQYIMDKQKYSGRTIECYVLWNSKLDFLKKAIELNPFLSDKFIWNDIGCLRILDLPTILKTQTDNNDYMNETDYMTYVSTISQIISQYPIYDNISHSKIDIVLLNPIQDETQSVFIDEIHFSGSIFGGDKDSILKFYTLFYKTLDDHIQNNIFVGCDQQTISSVYNKNKELFNCVTPNHLNHNIFNADWIWFYLWIYYGMNNKS
jgi:hypothetical protein